MFYTSVCWLGMILMYWTALETKGKQTDEIEIEYLEFAETKTDRIAEEVESLKDELNDTTAKWVAWKEESATEFEELKDTIENFKSVLENNTTEIMRIRKENLGLRSRFGTLNEQKMIIREDSVADESSRNSGEG